jgi:hypothetical protein
MIFQMGLVCFPAPAGCLGDTSAAIDSYEKRFDASDDARVIFNETFPRANEPLHPLSDASVPVGYPLYSGQRYELRFSMQEQDLFTQWEQLGTATIKLEQANSWGLGTHTVRSLKGNDPGDFEVTYEIRPTPLPDLQPTLIEVVRPEGSSDHVVCVGVANRGERDAGPFQVALHLNSVDPAAGTVDFESMPAGQHGKLCLHTDLPKSGIAQLTEIVDAPRRIAEQSEINNRLDYAYDPKGTNDTRPTGPLVGVNTDPAPTGPPILQAQMPPNGSSGPSASTQPEAPKPAVTANRGADLQVGTVQVKGRDGGSCMVRGDRNVVTATIRNTGDKPAKELAVEVRVGNERRGRKTVASLGADAETQVVIQNVLIDKGEHAVQVVADPDNAVTEDDDGNNSKTVEVDCSRS